MPDLFRHCSTRYIDAQGKRASKNTPGARAVRELSKKWHTRMKVRGKWKAVPLSSNKTAATIMAGKLLSKQEMGRAGVTDRYEEHSKAALAQHLKDWQASLEAKESTAKHVQMKVSRTQGIIEHCKFIFISDLSAPEVESCLAGFRKRPRFSIQTSNHYLKAIKGFTHWLARNKRMPDDPLSHLQLGNVALDRRHDRREISGPELAHLFQSTHNGPKRCKLTGPDRVMAYCVAAYTGLRASEIASLEPKSFNLEKVHATVTVAAGYSKRRREDVLPLHPDLVDRLAVWLTDKPAAGSLWPGKWALHNHAGKILKRDLKSARAAWLEESQSDDEREFREKSDFLAYRDSKGLYADFHALRHSFVSRLVRAGVKPKVAQALARHSTITLTMDRYAHLGLEDTHDGVSQMAVIPQASDGFGCRLAVYDHGKDRDLTRTIENGACLTAEDGSLQVTAGNKHDLLTMKGETLSFQLQAPIAQLDRASVYGTEVAKSQPHTSKRTYSKQPPQAVHVAVYDADLFRLIESWGKLPKATKQALLAIVDASAHRSKAA